MAVCACEGHRPWAVPLVFLASAGVGIGATFLAKRILKGDLATYLSVGGPVTAGLTMVNTALVWRATEKPEPTLREKVAAELQELRTTLAFEVPEPDEPITPDEEARAVTELQQLKQLCNQMRHEQSLRKLVALRGALKEFGKTAHVQVQGGQFQSPVRGASDELARMQLLVDRWIDAHGGG